MKMRAALPALSELPPVSSRVLWSGAVALALGAVLVSGAWEQETPALRVPLSEAVPVEFGGYLGTDLEITEVEREAAGFTDYLLREYQVAAEGDSEGGEAPWFSVYVGYYDTQTRGRTIHSPKNCLPGSGWEALGSTRVAIVTPGGEIEVNRYLLQREGEQALVLYWYQGRGRVVASEYRAKWDLLRDAALLRRSEESLVRIVVPILGSEEEAFGLASRVAAEVGPAVDRAMPVL